MEGSMTKPGLFHFRVLFIPGTVATTKILVARGLWFGTVLFLLLFDAIPAQAARCSYPTQFYRPSLGVCEPKAGNPLYRAEANRKTFSKKVKSVGRLEIARSQQKALPREPHAPAVQPEIIRKAKAILAVTPDPQRAEDQIADFEARWWPVREVSDHHLRATDGVRNRASETPAEVVQ
jgi:hypothetical protein